MGHFHTSPPSNNFPFYFEEKQGKGKGGGWDPTALADAILWSSSRKTENSESW